MSGFNKMSYRKNYKSQYSFLGPVTLVFQSLYTGSELDVVILNIALASLIFCVMYFINYSKTLSINLWASNIIIHAIFSYYVLIQKDITIPSIAIIAFQTIVSTNIFFISFCMGLISSIILLIYYGYIFELFDWKAFGYMSLIFSTYHVIYNYFLRYTKKINLEVLVHDIKSALSANYSYLSTVKELFLSGSINKSKGFISIDYKKDFYIDLLRFSKLTVDVALKTENVLRSSRKL